MQQTIPRPEGSAPTGLALAERLARRHPAEDWVAALAKGAVMSRIEVEAALASDQPAPPRILAAVDALERMLQPPDPQGQDDVFEARTNDRDATMEVDAEAGLTNVPSPKPHPSRSDSPHSMGERKEDYQNDGI
jgi:hypothetical protein